MCLSRDSKQLLKLRQVHMPMRRLRQLLKLKPKPKQYKLRKHKPKHKRVLNKHSFKPNCKHISIRCDHRVKHRLRLKLRPKRRPTPRPKLRLNPSSTPRCCLQGTHSTPSFQATN